MDYTVLLTGANSIRGLLDKQDRSGGGSGENFTWKNQGGDGIPNKMLDLLSKLQIPVILGGSIHHEKKPKPSSDLSQSTAALSSPPTLPTVMNTTNKALF